MNTIENALKKQAKSTKDVDEISASSHTSSSSSGSKKISKRDSEFDSDSSGGLVSNKPAAKKVRCLFPAANEVYLADLYRVSIVSKVKSKILVADI